MKKNSLKLSAFLLSASFLLTAGCGKNDTPTKPVDSKIETLRQDSVAKLKEFRISVADAKGALSEKGQANFDKFFQGGMQGVNSGNAQRDSIGGAKEVFGFYNANGGATAGISNMNDKALTFEEVIELLQKEYLH